MKNVKEFHEPILIRVFTFLPFRELLKVALTCKKFRDCASKTHLIHHQERKDHGRLPQIHGEKLSHLLGFFRYGVLEMNLDSGISTRAKMLVNNPSDMYLLAQHGLHEDIFRLNASVYSYWDYDATGGPGVFRYMQDMADENIIRQRDNGETLELMSCVDTECIYWKDSRIRSDFFIVLERPDGCIMIDESTNKVYLVLGIKDPIGSLITSTKIFSLPVKIKATLLPFKGYIAYDGVFVGMPTNVSKTKAKKLYKRYEEAVDKRQIISKLELVCLSKENLERVKRDRKLHEKNDMREEFDKSFVPTLDEQEKIRRLKKLQKLPMDHPQGIFVFRRYGYTEAENPDHMVCVLSGPTPISNGYLTFNALVPTAKEIFDISVDLLLNNTGMVTGIYPSIIATDEITILSMLKAYFKDTGIKTMYYPPPSEEEDYLRGGRRCANCGVVDAEQKLMHCGRCKYTPYCSKECQKSHWKKHKKECKVI